MAQHLFTNFLSDSNEYRQAEQYWKTTWDSIPLFNRIALGWNQPWFPSTGDGNPIFTAISQNQKKAIRIVQFVPSSDVMECDWWLDTFGGPLSDPSSLRELVIACALSQESIASAYSLMSAWVIGEIEIQYSALPQYPSGGMDFRHTVSGQVTPVVYSQARTIESVVYQEAA